MVTSPNDRRAGDIRRAVDGILAFGCIVSGVARTYGRVVYGVFVTILPVGVFVFVAPFFGGRTDFTGILIALELGLQQGFFLRGKMLVFADGVSQRVENGFCFRGFFCLFAASSSAGVQSVLPVWVSLTVTLTVFSSSCFSLTVSSWPSLSKILPSSA